MIVYIYFIFKQNLTELFQLVFYRNFVDVDDSTCYATATMLHYVARNYATIVWTYQIKLQTAIFLFRIVSYSHEKEEGLHVYSLVIDRLKPALTS